MDKRADEITTQFTLNGLPVSAVPRAGERLSEMLRERLDTRDVKIGCNAGDCGACTVLLDGAPVCAWHLFDELIGREPGQVCIEGKLVKVIHAQFVEPVRLGLRIHQAKGRGVRCKEAARMGLESHNTQRRAFLRRGSPRNGKDGLMPKMHAIEIANSDSRAFIG